MYFLKFFIFSTLISAIKSIVGDIKIDPKATVYKDSIITISFYITDYDITFLVNFTQFGYFAILYQNYMNNGDFTIVQINSKTTCTNSKNLILLSDAYGTKNHAKPSMDIKSNFKFKIDDVKLLGYDTDCANFLVVKYNRLLNTNDTQDTILYRNQSFNFSYAYHLNSKTLSKHTKTERNFFFGILNNNYQIGYGYTNPVFRHGVLLTVSWCFLADIAIFIKFLNSLKYNVPIHGLIFLIIFFITGQQLLAVYNFLMPSLQTLDDLASSHYIISIMFVFFVLLQIILGLVSKFLQNGEQINPEIHGIIRNIHKYSGYVIILIAKINCIIGWILFEVKIAIIIVSIEIFLVIILFLIFRIYFVKKLEQNIFLQKNISPTTQWIDIDLILQQSYNSPKLDTLKYFIFNNQIYLIPQNFTHPGGAKIIKLINHREIDRYMIGQKALQFYPNHTKYSHTLSSLQILGMPIYNIPVNPIYSFPNNQQFIIATFENINSQMRICYLKPEFGRIKFEKQYNLTHIGQYFILNGYKKSKIFPCTISFRHSNKIKMQNMLEKKQINILQSNKIDLNDNLETARQIMNQVGQQPSNFIGVSGKLTKFDQFIPIVVKKSNTQFSSFQKFFFEQNFQVLRFKLQGLKGKGFNINLLKEGDIYIICDGDGILPFLDLFDILFKIILAQNKKINQEQLLKEIQVYKHLLEKHKFFLISQFYDKNDLIYVDELISMAKYRSQIFKMRLKFFFKNSGFTSQGNQFQKYNQFQTRQNLQDQILEKSLIPNKNNISMIFVSGTAQFSKRIYESLKKKGIQQKYIYLT